MYVLVVSPVLLVLDEVAVLFDVEFEGYIGINWLSYSEEYRFKTDELLFEGVGFCELVPALVLVLVPALVLIPVLVLVVWF